MNANSMQNLVRKFVTQYGVMVSWTDKGEQLNSRGQPIAGTASTPKTAKALLLKQKYDPLQVITKQLGLTQDYTRFIMALPDIELKKDMVITDNHGTNWKLGIIDWFDVGGIPIAKQATLLEVA